MQVEIIKDLPEDKAITVYRCGPLVDLCRGPHIPNTSFAKALKCLKVTELTPLSCAFNYFLENLSLILQWLNLQASSSYWRGKSDRESLQRVYGISFPDAKRLKVDFCIACQNLLCPILFRNYYYYFLNGE